jgi:uncharacterized protein YabE (DUF348 family)
MIIPLWMMAKKTTLMEPILTGWEEIMIELLKKHRNWLFPAAFVLIASGLFLCWLGLSQEVTLTVNEEPVSVRTAAFRVAGVLRSAGFSPQDNDRIFPSPGSWFWRPVHVHIEPARMVMIKTPGEEISLTTAERIPANILKQAGIDLYPADVLRVDGLAVDPAAPLAGAGPVMLQFQPAVPVTLSIDGREITIYSSQPTLGGALEAAGILLAPEDWISESLSAGVEDLETVAIRRAQPVTILSQDQVILTGTTAAQTVGEALADLGLALQNLNYSIPPEEDDIPEDRQIRLVQAHETLLVATEEVAHGAEYQEDPNTPLDQYSVIKPGQNSIVATRERVHYEDGEEIWRATEPAWQASEAETAILGYGTQIVIRTEVVDGQTIEYWRKKTVYATSYKPCNDYTGECHDGTAGGYPLQKGIVAVMPWWYSVPNGLAMADLRVYIAGYGEAIVGDTCGGCSGNTPWIDLAYREENYVPWHHWTTMYFLTPVPAYYPAIITP